MKHLWIAAAALLPLAAYAANETQGQRPPPPCGTDAGHMPPPRDASGTRPPMPPKGDRPPHDMSGTMPPPPKGERPPCGGTPQGGQMNGSESASGSGFGGIQGQ